MFFIQDGDMEIREVENEEYIKLKDLYNKVQNTSDLRSKDSQEIGKEFDDKIKEVDKIYSRLNSDKLKAMACLVKGTVVFRRAQDLERRYKRSDAYYAEATSLFEMAYIKNEYSLINMLTLLNLGKNLRNMGMHGYRSDYDRALDCFKYVQENIENNVRDKDNIQILERWETCLWLEARINIGRIHKYLYNLEEAKADLWDILYILLKKEEEDCEKENIIKKDKSLFQTVNTAVKKDYLLKKDKEKSGNLSWMQKYLLYCKEDYRRYLQQVLVELGTVYLKERYFDAAKNLFLLTIEINEENVDAKNNIAVYLRKRNMPGDYRKAIKILRTQAEAGNRFAQNNIFKCQIALIGNCEEDIESEAKCKEIKGKKVSINNILMQCGNYDEGVYSEKALKKEIKREIKKYPDDLELRLLLGLYYKKKQCWDKALTQFKYIYQKSPYIRKGTIGLKAYYNIIQEMIRRQQFYQAKEGLEKIISECERDFKDKPGQQIDFLAEMDLGWCLQNLGYYKFAQESYEKILNYEKEKKEQDKRYTTKRWNLTRVRNNLGECYLYQGKNQEALRQFKAVLKIEKDNSRANRGLGQYYLQNARMCEKNRKYDSEIINLEKAIKSFKNAAYVESDNIEINSGLIIAQCKVWSNKFKRGNSFSEDIENKLRFMNNSFSMKACFAFANYIEMVDEEERKKDILYRAFARIKLGKEEEAYTMFDYFQNESSIRRLSTESRGKMLAKLLKIYENVLAVKKICRYTPKNEEEKIVPVHYTSLKTLKILLNNEVGGMPRLRLWNTADMNDPFEGEAFIELLREVSRSINQNQQEKTEESEVILEKYFKHLSNSTNGLVPSNGNIYITSFTKCEDFIPMWNAYAEDAKGCSIKFGDDFFDIKKETDIYTGVSSYSDKSYLLYEVLYLNPKEKSIEEDRGKGNSDKFEKVKIHLSKIWELLTDFEIYLHEELIKKEREKSLCEEATEVARKVIADFLNEIRFLFKYNEYSYEEEVRLIKCSYEPKLDKDNFEIPRLYIEVGKDINRLKEVCLGKKISQGEINKLVSWLYGTGKVEKITISSRHYQ